MTNTCANATNKTTGDIICMTKIELKKFFPASNMTIGLARRKTRKEIGTPNETTTLKALLTNKIYSSFPFSSIVKFNRGINTVVSEVKTEMIIRIILFAP